MDCTNAMDKNSPMPVKEKQNSVVMQDSCGKEDMLQNNGVKKRIRKRKPKPGVSKDTTKEMTTCLCEVGVKPSCATKPEKPEVLTETASIPPEIGEASKPKSPKKSIGKKGKKQDSSPVKVKSDENNVLKQNAGYLCAENVEGKVNQVVASSPKNGLCRERKQGVSNYAFKNFPLGPKKEHSRKQVKELKSFPQSKPEPLVDEDLFEEYVPINVVEGLLQLPYFLQGVIRINKGNYTEAYISDPSGKRDILIEGIRNRNRALEGDEVAVAILPESQWKEISAKEKQQTGKVIHLLKAVHPRQAIGVLKPMPMKNSPQALFSPRDSRIPRMRVPIQECPPNLEACGDQLFLARIVKWENVRFARGSIMGGSIGLQGDIDSETDAILLENQIRSLPYPPDLIPHFPDKLTENDYKNREDLRKECIFSIDPLTARDLDDAVSCEVLENGNILVGVHISDVSYFLQEDTPLDRLVSETATTTYLVQSVYHMLPRPMTMKCSLLPGEDKLAFSVFWEMQETDDELKVVSKRFTRSVINSCAQLAYEHAQTMLENPKKEWKDGELPTIYNGFTPQKLSSVVCTLNRLATKLRNRRFESGSLKIDQTKLNFSLDEDGLPSAMNVYENKESHRLIEEFMLLANITVATTLHEAFPKIAFLRQHSPPLKVLVEKLTDQLEMSGILIDCSSAGALQQSLATYRGDNSLAGMARSVALNCLFSRPMARAKYFCLSTAKEDSDMAHYALNVPLYTHFTSPIRRYADVMVHRLLAAYLGYSSPPVWTEKFVAKVASNCNMRKYNAKKAGEQSSELFLAVYLKEKGPIKGYAVVVDVKDRSFDAIFCATGTTVRVYSDKIGAGVEHRKKGDTFDLVLTWFPQLTEKPVSQVISAFSIVNMLLQCSTTSALKLEAVLLPPWEDLGSANLPEHENSNNSVQADVNSAVNEPGDIDLSNIKLPDILDDVQECTYSSDDGASSPESLCESSTPSEDEELKNVTLITGCNRF